MPSPPPLRYPDLTGKAGIVAGSGPLVVGIAQALAANNVLLAIVSTDRAIVEQAVQTAESHHTAVLGMTTDPASPQVWERITQHIEQRLGPIDLAVAIGAPKVREAVRGALAADMSARRRGVLIEVGDIVPSAHVAEGTSHVCINTSGTSTEEVIAAVVRAASDSERPQTTG